MKTPSPYKEDMQGDARWSPHFKAGTNEKLGGGMVGFAAMNSTSTHKNSDFK
jgi:hypothetical protein